ncbi:hypothetical protein EKD16_21170 [Streptomonospora litoralis]|uniref:Uncharacterized protein n=1 Tax=Streptomonospora litoralis TaxID=2498135 RepID=A0A4P6Q6M8_9ACTN|nr:hypothetical protein EKD16_21170 [Streptomonospora litoralis]
MTEKRRRRRRMAGPAVVGSGARRWRRPTGAATPVRPGLGWSGRWSPALAVGGRARGSPLDCRRGPDAGRSAAVMQPDRGHEMHVSAAASASVPPRGIVLARSFRDTKQHGVFCPPMPESPVGPRPRRGGDGARGALNGAKTAPGGQLFVRLVASAPAEAARKTGIGPQKSASSGGGATGGDAGAPRATCRRPRPPIRRTFGPCGRPRPRPAARLPARAGPAGTRRRRLPAPAPAMTDVPGAAAGIVAKIPKTPTGIRHTATIVPPLCDITDTRPLSGPAPPLAGRATTGHRNRHLRPRSHCCRRRLVGRATGGHPTRWARAPPRGALAAPPHAPPPAVPAPSTAGPGPSSSPVPAAPHPSARRPAGGKAKGKSA